MSIRCPDCNREYDVTLFEFEKTFQCVCGHLVTLQHREMSGVFRYARIKEDTKVAEIRNRADKIASLIVSTDYPLIDIEIEKQKFKERIQELFPDKIYLYTLIYESRFRRLEEQFREDN
ncbi:hypothetical protein EP227_05880 [bacterium]|nr:MAG: hypothetical protein EP227_05880 [bacterium]